MIIKTISFKKAQFSILNTIGWTGPTQHDHGGPKSSWLKAAWFFKAETRALA